MARRLSPKAFVAALVTYMMPANHPVTCAELRVMMKVRTREKERRVGTRVCSLLVKTSCLLTRRTRAAGRTLQHVAAAILEMGGGSVP